MIVILSGAGLSAGAGIPTYRGQGSDDSTRSIFTHDTYVQNPELVEHTVEQLRDKYKLCVPREAHKAIAQLTTKFPDKVIHITQNIDDLCEKAGDHPIHMHGSWSKLTCKACNTLHDLTADKCQRCGAPLRTSVVLFGEQVCEQQRILYALKRCTVFIAVGTSGVVYPAADFVRYAFKNHYCYFRICCNVEPSNNKLFNYQLIGDVNKTLPPLLEYLEFKFLKED